jgi:hypothetical protein
MKWEDRLSGEVLRLDLDQQAYRKAAVIAKARMDENAPRYYGRSTGWNGAIVNNTKWSFSEC